MATQRYLTKSRFKLACECPTKLFYTRKEEYPDSKLDDKFLEALADGGFQVGELAKYYYRNGIDIKTLNYDESLVQTKELLKRDNVTIYEAAISHENLFIRADILVKTGQSIKLIEVKAKSYDPGDPDQYFIGKKGGIKSEWRPYLEDVAFQKYVLEKSYPTLSVSACLMLVDKSAICPTDGLNQKFQIVRDDSNVKGIAVSSNLSEEDLAIHILREVSASDPINIIMREKDEGLGMGFVEKIHYFAECYAFDKRIDSRVGSKCKKCEFVLPDFYKSNQKSGFVECWVKQTGLNASELEQPLVLDIWNFRSADKLIQSGCLKISQVEEKDINIKNRTDGASGLSSSRRQMLQIEKVKNNDNSHWIDEGLRDELSSWTYPLNFIDFETAMPAIPFNRGRHPYEGIAFQFSHHIVDKDFNIAHVGEYINTQVGEFPNFEFVRQLKASLDTYGMSEAGGYGTILRYSSHENTYLNMVASQIEKLDPPLEDGHTLLDFIYSITNKKSERVGPHNMVDMLDVVKRLYYHPATNGSNSIKAVLPAILNESEYLKKKYSKPVYGKGLEISSKNFENWRWVVFDDDGNTVKDPYKLLPDIFDGIPFDKLDELDILFEDAEIREGGAAMMAYAKLQFTVMSDIERQAIIKSLLKYCELDTLAMVMIYEAWREWIKP